MTPAVFILCGLWCGHSPLRGAYTVAPGGGAVHVGGGVNVVLPTLALGATLGVASRVDVTLTYETHAGLAHVFSAAARVRLSERWATTHTLSHGLFVVEEIGGIQSARSPFGNGLTTTHSAVFSRWNLSGLHLALTVEWAARGAGTWWLQVRALVPIQAEFSLLGYLPMVLVGRSWSLE